MLINTTVKPVGENSAEFVTVDNMLRIKFRTTIQISANAFAYLKELEASHSLDQELAHVDETFYMAGKTEWEKYIARNYIRDRIDCYHEDHVKAILEIIGSKVSEKARIERGAENVEPKRHKLGF